MALQRVNAGDLQRRAKSGEVEMVGAMRRGVPARQGRWVLDPDSLVVGYYQEGQWFYEVDLEQCTNSAEILDWVVQAAHKPWCQKEDLADLIYFLDALFGGLQRNVCGVGAESPVSIRALL